MDQKHCLSINELKVPYLEWEKLNINNKYYSFVLKYLLDILLKDNSLNTYEYLITVVKKLKFT